jgi:hypothetical protein
MGRLRGSTAGALSRALWAYLVAAKQREVLSPNLPWRLGPCGGRLDGAFCRCTTTLLSPAFAAGGNAGWAAA